MIGRRIQNFKVVSLLGIGGMGSVYKVYDTFLERYAALKIINVNSIPNPRFIERFKREARNQANLSHPNIVSVYGFVQEKDILGIVMEYIHGQTIENIIGKNGRFDLYYATELLEQILNGIEAAHNSGFIHRDLKPSNIILDHEGNPKIMDFGISKSIEDVKTVTQHNSRPGTLLYMSPEQLSGNVVTIKSDIYALGITYYEMLTGNHPYQANNIYEIIDAHVNQVPEKLTNILPGIPDFIDEIILRAIGKAGDSSFQNAREFNEALRLVSKIDYFTSSGLNQYVPEDDFTPLLGEDDVKSEKTESKAFGRITNILLILVFIVLAVIVYNVVKKTIDEYEKDDINSLNYSQDYSKNPHFVLSTDWINIKINTDANLNTLYFTNDYNGFIAGDSGIFFRTVNAGVNWEPIKTSYTNDFHSISFSDNKIFVAGSKGFIGIYNDKNKQLKKINTGVSESIFQIIFISEYNGFAVGSNGLILKTEDGGLTWNRRLSNVSENLFSIDFSDDVNGTIVGWDGIILKTINGGESWSRISSDYKSYFKDVIFVNEFLGFIVGGNGLILRSENGGNSWKAVNLNSTSGLYKIFFDNNDNGIIITNRGEVLLSSDAGKSWKMKSIGKPVVLNDIKRLNSGNYMIAGNNGSLFKSTLQKK